MLRRRRRGPKQIKRQSPYSAAPAPQSRRRGRPDAPVPEGLKIQKHPLPGPLPRDSGEKPSRHPHPRPLPRERENSGGGEGHEVVLVTGFHPFGGETCNPSWDLCGLLAPRIDGMRVETVSVPCEFRRSIETVAAAIERHHPTLVICVGQAGGRAHIAIERVAINVDDARTVDNAGTQPIDEPIAPNGPPAYFATVPVKAMAAAIRAAGIPAEVSNSAGTYVCNHLMYGVLHYLAASGNRARVGFIHVPYAEQQVLDKRGTPAMAVSSMAKAIEAAIVAAHRHRHDVPVSEGGLD